MKYSAMKKPTLIHGLIRNVWIFQVHTLLYHSSFLAFDFGSFAEKLLRSQQLSIFVENSISCTEKQMFFIFAFNHLNIHFYLLGCSYWMNAKPGWVCRKPTILPYAENLMSRRSRVMVSLRWPTYILESTVWGSRKFTWFILKLPKSKKNNWRVCFRQ